MTKILELFPSTGGRKQPPHIHQSTSTTGTADLRDNVPSERKACHIRSKHLCVHLHPRHRKHPNSPRTETLGDPSSTLIPYSYGEALFKSTLAHDAHSYSARPE
ncbi:hypothetical protein FRC02_010258 [Tulasnella sp. 418]|nr:hypothetical protein FRC02_010258 [Tulasnella sp. 418]